MQTNDLSDWQCSICLEHKHENFGQLSRSQISKCKHIFHLGCIQEYFLSKNQDKKEIGDYVLECPLCRCKTQKNNWGVRVLCQNNQFIIKKDSKFIHFQLNTYGKGIGQYDIKKAKCMLQEIADYCFDVESYWLISNYLPQKFNEQYADDKKKCAKLICLPSDEEEEKEVYIEKSFNI